MFASLRRRLSGQSGSEYMMVISVVTIAVVGAAYTFVPQFRDGTTHLGNEVRDILGTGNARGAGATAANGGDSSGPGADGADSSSTDPGLGEATNPAGGESANGEANDGGQASDTRYQRNNQHCFMGFCWGTRETAIGGGTGGEGTVAEAQEIQEGADSDRIDGAWKSFFQGDVAQTAAAASEALADKPLCGPAIVAALTGMTIDEAYSDLENNGRLALVKKETTVAGLVVNTEYTTNGVMSESQLARALRDDYGFQVGEKSNASLRDIGQALSRGEKPIVLYDNGDGSGTNGHFGVVSDIAPGLGVKVDTATGSYWIPPQEFQRRMDVMGGRLITASPPSGRNGEVARAP